MEPFDVRNNSLIYSKVFNQWERERETLLFFVPKILMDLKSTILTLRHIFLKQMKE